MLSAASMDRAVDARPLAVARMGVGAAALLKGVDLWGLLHELADPTRLRVPWWGLPVPPQELVPVLVLAWMAVSLGLCLGRWTRTSGALLAAGVALLLGLDRQLYGNHLYLLGLLCGLLAVADAGAVWSLDARRTESPRRRLVPAWPVTLLQVQLSVVYGFAALAKLNAHYLSGGLLAGFLQGGLVSFPDVWRVPAVMAPLAVASVTVEAGLALALWSPRWRRPAAVGGVVFHLAILLTMQPALQLAVFGLEMVALYPLFLHDPVEKGGSERLQEATFVRAP